MSKPGWINEVKEISLEEARLIVSLGASCRADYNYKGRGWYRSPSPCRHIRTRYDIDTFLLYLDTETDADWVFWVPEE